MDLRQIKNLIEAFEDSTVYKLTIDNDEFKISLEKEPKPQINTPNLPPQISNEDLKDDVISSSETTSNNPTNTTIIKAPLVGTFYASPSPDSAPFVHVGDTVIEGDTLFIVEAMKVMNEVKAPCRGEIVKIHIEDGSMIEFNQAIMEIK